ncbi:MAG: hypothetical protein ACYC3S_10270 [Chloroflexota bacterium]
MATREEAVNPNDPRPVRRWLSRRAILIVAEAAFVVWVVYTVGGGLWQANARQPWSIPHALGDLELAGEAAQGQDAIAQMTELHGKDVELSDGYVAHYKGAGREAMLYVGQAQSVSAADVLTERMRERIAGGSSPFKGLTRQALEGRAVYKVTGLGGEHYFFSVGDKAVWLSVAGGKAESVLRSAMSVLKE